MSPTSPSILPLLATLATSACSAYTLAKSPAPLALAQAPTNQAKVCVLRSDDLPAPLYTTVVYDNGKLVGATKNETYFCYTAEPGKHAILSDATFGDQSATFEAKAGATYYLKQTWLIPAVRGHELSWLDERAAVEELREDEYVILAEVPETQEIPGAAPFAPATP